MCRWPQAVLRNLEKLQALLPTLSKVDVITLIVQRPALLTRSDDTLHRTFKVLSIWDLSQDYKAELLKVIRLGDTSVGGMEIRSPVVNLIVQGAVGSILLCHSVHW